MELHRQGVIGTLLTELDRQIIEQRNLHRACFRVDAPLATHAAVGGRSSMGSGAIDENSRPVLGVAVEIRTIHDDPTLGILSGVGDMQGIIGVTSIQSTPPLLRSRGITPMRAR
jgi:hypothetical protein